MANSAFAVTGTGGNGNGATTILNYNGSTQAILNSVNVSSVTYQNVGRYRVTFTTAYPDGKYTTMVATTPAGGGTTAQTAFVFSNATTTTGYVDVESAGTLFYDNEYFGVAIFGT